MIVVIPTEKTENEYFQTLFGRCLLAAQQSSFFDTKIIEQNKTGLSKMFNDILKTEKHDNVVFMHDDVEIHDLFFAQKLKMAHKHFDIVGLAGATQQTYKKGRNHLWHVSTEPDNLRGFVSHYIPDKNQPFYNSTYFGKTPDEVAAIDGLFMSIKVSALKDELELFDNDFNFHHYDLSMSLRAKRRGLKIGVWPIFVVHHGLGEFNTPDWYYSNKEFDNKYAL